MGSMKCVIPGVHMKVFGRAIQSLSKIGDELYFEPLEEGLSLRTVNSSRSAYACFQFAPNFFITYITSGGPDRVEESSEDSVRCKLTMKSVMNVFRSLPTIDKTVERCKITFNWEEDKLVFQMCCRHGIMKTHNLSFMECETLQAIFSRDSCPNKLTASSKLLCDAVVNFQPNQEEVTLLLRPDFVALKNYVEDEPNPTKVIHTELTLSPDEFDHFQFGADADVTFCLKEFRAILAFSDLTNLPLNLHVESPGRPITFSVTSDLSFEANFVLATLAEPDDAPYQSQSQAATSTSTTKGANHSSKSRNTNTRGRKPAASRHQSSSHSHTHDNTSMRDEEEEDDDDEAIMAITNDTTMGDQDPPRIGGGGGDRATRISNTNSNNKERRATGISNKNSNTEERCKTSSSGNKDITMSRVNSNGDHHRPVTTVKTNNHVRDEEPTTSTSRSKTSEARFYVSASEESQSQQEVEKARGSGSVKRSAAGEAMMTTRVADEEMMSQIIPIRDEYRSVTTDTTISNPANDEDEEKEEDDEEVCGTPPSKRFRSLFFSTQSSTQSTVASQPGPTVLCPDSDSDD